MKKLLASIIAIIFVAFLSACSSTPATTPLGTPSKASAGITSAPEAPVVDITPVTWNGVWVTHPEFMSLEIVDNLVTIHIVTADSKSLFWKGTWDPAAKTIDATKIVSKADISALSSSIMGSSEKTKPFTYANGEITFEFSMMGTTKTVHVVKNS